MIDLQSDLLEKYDIPTPRYTSYPIATQFQSLSSSEYKEKLLLFDEELRNLSIYIHIPFCSSMCLFCGCSVVLNRNEDKQQKYVDMLKKEIALVCSSFKNRHIVKQFHFGGGTPTNLNERQFLEIIKTLKDHFEFIKEIEMSIEIDPRNVIKDGGKKLKFLKELGFNRISFGIQDTDIKVQRAVRRNQTHDMSLQTYLWARQIGFDQINLDLIYGLPMQTLETFDLTAKNILKMRPDRIALFSYAKVPWLKPHQKAIKEAQLPSQREKLAIYQHARKAFIEKGYIAIGMDHFALPNDMLAKAFFSKTLDRNFQGYSTSLAKDMISFGMSSIGYVQGGYFQNEKNLKLYEDSVSEGVLPVAKGYLLNHEDHIRSWTIKKIMCDFELDKNEFKKLFKVEFDVFFSNLYSKIKELQLEGLVVFNADNIKATKLGQLFIRVVASTFDQYYTCKLNKHSRSV